MEYERHDAILMEILKEKRTMCGFLESVFGFLSRHTDFYYIMKNDRDNMGFPKGYKEKLVHSVLRKFDKFESPQHVTLKNTTTQNISLPVSTSTKPPQSVTQEIKVSDYETIKCVPNSNVIISTSSNSRSTMISTPLLKCDKFHSNEYYNGAAYDTYCWSQSATDIEIHINLPDHITTAKQLTIKIDTDHIKIIEKINNKIILEGNIIKKCKHNDAVWSLSSGKLQITLDKIQETWWNQFLDNEPQIDLTKMDCSRTIDEFPDETQAVIEKLKWDQHQQMLGLPTSEEIKNHEMLRKAWDADGSPFKGQPFDPSVVKFN